MSCCDNMMSPKERDARLAGYCDSCGAAIDSEGNCIELDNCSYSPVMCEKCGYRLCDESC